MNYPALVIMSGNGITDIEPNLSGISGPEETTYPCCTKEARSSIVLNYGTTPSGTFRKYTKAGTAN